MKLLFASDSFKGSLTSREIAALLEEAAAEVFPGAETVPLCVADGGEGTMEILVQALGGRWERCTVPGPLGEPVEARYGLLPGGRAVIEMAEASGLTLVPPRRRSAARTTTFGTGALLRRALDRGVRDITIAIGGSATNDGGLGAMQALGAVFLDGAGEPVPGCGEGLARVARVDLAGLHPAVRESRFTVMCDVTNPLLGPEGATWTFGRQKGADDALLERLEEGMARYAAVVEAALGCSCAGRPGAGAAGGLGFALMAFLGAEARPGIETVLDLLDFDRKLEGVDLVITGEGRMDGQSAFGKVPAGVGRRCRRAGVPAAAVVGGLLPGYESIYDCGIGSVVTTIRSAATLEEAMADSRALYRDAARRLLRLIRCGMELRGPGGEG